MKTISFTFALSTLFLFILFFTLQAYAAYPAYFSSPSKPDSQEIDIRPADLIQPELGTNTP